MKPKRIILELGAGASLHGGDYTKAALRAVDDAIHHSSLSFVRNLGLDAKKMEVTVTIGDRSARGRLTERTPWSTFSVVGFGAPPFALEAVEVDVPLL